MSEVISNISPVQIPLSAQTNGAEQSTAETLSIFQKLIENASEGIVMSDAEGTLLYANPAFYKERKYDPTEQKIIGKKIADMYPESELPRLGAFIEQIMQGKTVEGETLQKCEDGSVYPISFSAFPIMNNTGVMTHIGAVTRSIAARKQAEAEQQRLQQHIIDAQREALKELSTPIIPLLDGIIIVPLIGTIDTARARDIMRALLQGIADYRAKIVILDITGVPVVDSGVANHLNKTIQAARLKGTQTIITGVSDAIAETIVDLGIDWSVLEVQRDLQTGLMTALNRLGMTITSL